jgi:predicted nucleic acid-binding protein
MTGDVFVDANVLVYARDAADPVKQRQAADWLAALWTERRGRLSVQVQNEFYVVATRKLRPGMPAADAQADVRALDAWRPLDLTPALTQEALALEGRFGLHFWDALVVAAARRAGCRFLLSEDLQAGQDFDGVVVVSPFRTAPGELG